MPNRKVGKKVKLGGVGPACSRYASVLRAGSEFIPRFWRGRIVVHSTDLESLRLTRPRGFESRPLR